uniref:Uncharacterized protein n=1 Tax=Timema genevievae TaxID=629358 RepID=A0A7R9K795_TIMGE|nr:unnamed protein product [Timema genevievae]
MIGLTAAILVVKDTSCQKECNHFNLEVECLVILFVCGPEVKEGFGNQINLCRDLGLNPGTPAQKSDTLPLDHQVTGKNIKVSHKLSSVQCVVKSSSHLWISNSTYPVTFGAN